MESFLEDVSWAKDLRPEDLSIDPERPVIEESIYELISRDMNGIFAKGILLLNELALTQPHQDESRKKLLPEVPEIRTRRAVLPGLDNHSRYRWYIITAIGGYCRSHLAADRSIKIIFLRPWFDE